ncbi:Phage shock protein [Moraxella macacae 0408225]|uniref:Phage shock protein n=1 Tax=Moraxella macacae 0408225 TaxID=1230338 RepID=L2F650_9GAMM|nr:rhodanese-like domain-containing protein [Moraxella macacae]ELA08507.1 Phage shock protein [Moraxella macacae 0408225]
MSKTTASKTTASKPKQNPVKQNLLKSLKFAKKPLFIASLVLAGFLLLPSVQAKTVVIDVRTPEEYQMNHPSGAINIPHSEIVTKISSQGISKSDNIKLYSGASSRAEKAKNELQSAGYSNVEVQN